GRLPAVHEPAMAPAGRVHRAHPDQSRGPALGHAPPHAGGDGRPGARRGLREGCAGGGPMGHLHGVGGPARRTPTPPPPHPPARRTLTLRAANCRVGSYSAAGAAALLALVPATWPWGVFLLWPAAALAFVAFAYFGGGPGVFCKTDGRLPLSTRFVLAPILLGQYLSLVCYRRRCRAWD